MSPHARRLEGGSNIDSQRLLHELMVDRIKQKRSRTDLEDKAVPGDRLSPGGPNHIHN